MAGQAFEGPRLNGFKLKPDEFTIIGLDTDDGSEHPLYDERIREPVNEGLVLNIMSLGVKKPVIVTKEGGKALVVDGRQRIRAARVADKRLTGMGEPGVRVPVLLEDRRRTSDDMLMAISISTNEFHMRDSPVVRAAKARRLFDRGLEEAEIAVYFGVSQKAIQNWLKLEGLPKATKRAIEEGSINATQALALVGLSAKEQKTAVDELKSMGGRGKGGKSTGADAKRTVAIVQRRSTNTLPSKRVLRYIVERKKEHELSSDFVRGVAFAIGLEDPEAISGLVTVLRRASEKAPAKKRGVAATA